MANPFLIVYETIKKNIYYKYVPIRYRRFNIKIKVLHYEINKSNFESLVSYHIDEGITQY